jgi:hypothetical protein
MINTLQKESYKMNQDYKSIQKYIRRAQLERQIYLANLMADGMIIAYDFVKRCVNAVRITSSAIFKGAQTRVSRSKNVFTFDV